MNAILVGQNLVNRFTLKARRYEKTDQIRNHQGTIYRANRLVTGLTLATIGYRGKPMGLTADKLEPARGLLRETFRSACGKLFVFCSVRTHGVSKTDERVRGLRWNARTYSYTRGCAPNVPRRATEELPFRGCVRRRPL